MLKMRLQRVGRRNNPSYRVVVVDSRQGPKSGKFIDQLGAYNPKAGVYEIDSEKATRWLKDGAQASPTVHNMLVSKKIVNKPKITVVAKPKEAAPVEAAAEAAPVAEASAEASA